MDNISLQARARYVSQMATNENARLEVRFALMHLEALEREYRRVNEKLNLERDATSRRFRVQLLPFLLFWGAFWTVLGVVWWNGWGYEPAFSAENIQRMVTIGAVVETIVVIAWLLFIGVVARRPSAEWFADQESKRDQLTREIQEKEQWLESIVSPLEFWKQQGM